VIVYVNKLIILSECILMMYAEIEIEIMQLLHYLCHTCVFQNLYLLLTWTENPVNHRY